MSTTHSGVARKVSDMRDSKLEYLEFYTFSGTGEAGYFLPTVASKKSKVACSAFTWAAVVSAGVLPIQLWLTPGSSMKSALTPTAFSLAIISRDWATGTVVSESPWISRNGGSLASRKVTALALAPSAPKHSGARGRVAMSNTPYQMAAACTQSLSALPSDGVQ